jgi:hypothetical protein
MRRILKWLLRYRLVWGFRYDSVVNALAEAYRMWQQDAMVRERELAETKKAVEQIVARNTAIRFDRYGDQYQVTLCFRPEMFGFGAAPRRELEILAEHMAARVRCEIMNAKFVIPAGLEEKYGRSTR